MFGAFFLETHTPANVWLCLLCDSRATDVILRLFRLLQLGSHSTPTYSGSAFYAVAISVQYTQSQSVHELHSTTEPFPGETLPVSIPHGSICPCLTLFICPFPAWKVAVDDVCVYISNALVTQGLIQWKLIQTKRKASIFKNRPLSVQIFLKHICIWSWMSPVFAPKVCVSVSVSRSGLSVCVRPCQAAEIDSMGGCTLSQASVTGLATSAAGQPSAPIVSEAQHSPARMAGLVKAGPFPSVLLHPSQCGGKWLLNPSKGQQKLTIKLEVNSISRLVFFFFFPTPSGTMTLKASKVSPLSLSCKLRCLLKLKHPSRDGRC